jgi:hypothetical protein
MLRDLGQEAERGQRNEKEVWCRAHHEAQGNSERVPLRGRETLEAVEQRPAQLVKRSERELHLRLHPHCPHYPQIRR